MWNYAIIVALELVWQNSQPELNLRQGSVTSAVTKPQLQHALMHYTADVASLCVFIAVEMIVESVGFSTLLQEYKTCHMMMYTKHKN